MILPPEHQMPGCYCKFRRGLPAKPTGETNANFTMNAEHAHAEELDLAISGQKIPAKPGCDVCGVELDEMVIALCRFNSKRFGGKKLCRTCQSASILF